MPLTTVEQLLKQISDDDKKPFGKFPKASISSDHQGDYVYRSDGEGVERIQDAEARKPFGPALVAGREGIEFFDNESAATAMREARERSMRTAQALQERQEQSQQQPKKKRGLFGR